MMYNIYYGTTDGNLKLRYRFTKNFLNEHDAKKHAKEDAASLYYKNEGNFGLPAYSQILKESEITGINLMELYNEHIEDLMKWYVVPTDLDTISKKNLRYY